MNHNENQTHPDRSATLSVRENTDGAVKKPAARDIVAEDFARIDRLLKQARAIKDGGDPGILRAAEDIENALNAIIRGGTLFLRMKARSLATTAAEIKPHDPKRGKEIEAEADRLNLDACTIEDAAEPLRKERARLMDLYREYNNIPAACPTCGAIHAGGEVNHDR